MLSIGKVHLSGRVTLAPMAGVTDAAFRGVCRELGAADMHRDGERPSARIQR